MIYTEVDQTIYELIGDKLHLEGLIPISACIAKRNSNYTLVSCIHMYETWELLTNEKHLPTQADRGITTTLATSLKDGDVPSTIITPVIIVSTEVEEFKNFTHNSDQVTYNSDLDTYARLLEGLSGYTYQSEFVDELRTIIGDSVGKDLIAWFKKRFGNGLRNLDCHTVAAAQIGMLYQFGSDALRNGMLCDPKAVQDCLLRDFGIEDIMKKHYPVEYFFKILEEIVEEYEIEELTKTGYEKYQLDKVIAQFRARLI